MKTQIYIDGKQFETTEQYLTGRELKLLAGIPLDTDLCISLLRPYEDEIISNDEYVNVSRPEVEYFYVPRLFNFRINDTTYQWYKNYISAEQLRKVGNIDPEYEVYIVFSNREAKLVTNDFRIDLADPEVDHFFSQKKQHEFTLIVNGRSKQWKQDRITFDQAVTLSFGKVDQSQSRAYTLTYSRGIEGKPEGIMVKGNEIRVKDKMIFNVTATDKS
jgi:hypothetical protein